MDAESFFRAGIGKQPLEVVVHVRRFEDIEQLVKRINEQDRQISKLQQDIYTWSLMGLKYQEANDEIRYLRSILKRHAIDF